MSRDMRSSVFSGFKVALLIFALMATAMFAAVITMHFAIHGAEVKVPSLTGMTIAQARTETAGMGLNLEVDNRYYSSEVGAGHILTQSPAAGSVVRRDWHVRVSESLGPQKVEVPDTVGSDEHFAALKLRRVGLAVGTTAHLPIAGAPEGKVLAQDPPAHAQGIEGPSVNLLVAAPADVSPDGFVMPDLKGMPIITAQATLAKVGLKSGIPKYVEVAVPSVGSGNVAPQVPVVPGSVIAQQPIAGTRVDQTMTVQLTAAR